MKIEIIEKEIRLLQKEDILSKKSVEALHQISLQVKKRVALLEQVLYDSPESLVNWMTESERCEMLAEFLCQYRNAYARMQRLIRFKHKQQVLSWLEAEEDEEMFSPCKRGFLPKNLRILLV